MKAVLAILSLALLAEAQAGVEVARSQRIAELGHLPQAAADSGRGPREELRGRDREIGGEGETTVRRQCHRASPAIAPDV